eukprot:snap_masked-scaffold_20-processed-gene-5.69-mRNA-1 protein AED:1.00 eAED:1.00 QI:0/0/0/0/1/1/2/0/67
MLLYLLAILFSIFFDQEKFSILKTVITNFGFTKDDTLLITTLLRPSYVSTIFELNLELNILEYHGFY